MVSLQYYLSPCGALSFHLQACSLSWSAYNPFMQGAAQKRNSKDGSDAGNGINTLQNNWCYISDDENRIMTDCSSRFAVCM